MGDGFDGVADGLRAVGFEVLDRAAPAAEFAAKTVAVEPLHLAELSTA